jgi:hypothetical protein
VSNESLLSWDKSDLLRGPWEDSFEERRDPGASDGVLFSPERKEVSGGLERGRWSEDEDLFSPVRLQFGRLTANDRGSENSGKTVSGATQGPEPGKETPNGAGTSGGTTQRIAQSKKDLAGRLSRWAMQLMEYKYTIAHKDGRLHADADALSRYPLAEGLGSDATDKESRDLVVNVVTQCDRSELQEGQRSEWAYSTHTKFGNTASVFPVLTRRLTGQRVFSFFRDNSC